MAALHPLGEGLPNAIPARSFAEVLSSPTTSKAPAPSTQRSPSLSFDDAVVGSHKGFPSMAFEDAHIADLTKSFPWTLIGKFSHGYNRADPQKGRPSVANLEKFFQSLDLQSSFHIGLLDNRHLLIRLSSEADYLRLYSRTVWYVAKVTMRILKWTPYFNVDRETSLVPVWVSLPRLPIIFFAKSALFRIASLLGTPLRLDSATVSLNRPGVARVQVEIDLLKERTHQIWIGMGSVTGFWQKIEYDHIPDYCKHCWHVGHSEAICTVHNPGLKALDRVVQPTMRTEYRPVVAQPKTQLPVVDAVQSAQPTVPSAVVASPQSAADMPLPHSMSQPPPSASEPTRPPPADPGPSSPHLDAIVSHKDGPHTGVLQQPSTDPETLLIPDAELARSNVVSDALAILPAIALTTQVSTDEVMQSHAAVSVVPPQQLASNIVEDASAAKPVTPAPSVVDNEPLPATVRREHVHSTVDEHLHGPVHQQCPSSSDRVLGPVPAPVLTIAKAAQQQFQHPAPCIQEAAQQLQRSEPQIESSPTATPTVLYNVSNLLEAVPVTVPTKEHVPATLLNPYAPAFQSPTPSEAYSSKSPIIPPPIIHTLPSQQHGHTFMGHDMGYNDSDYYHDSFGADEFGFDDEEATDEHTYDDITDGSEGTHSRKKKDRRNLKGSVSTISATKEELSEQSRLLGIRIRNRGRPPGSRNRTYFGMVRTMETRASKSISN